MNNITNINGDNEIDMINIDETQSIKELTKVAKSLNLKQGGKKSEIIERIKNHLKQLKNNNNRNKEQTITTTTTTKTTNGNTELLFWKVFRNIFIFKCITSNFSEYRYHKYDNQKQISTMITNNHLNLLFDKLKRDQELINIQHGRNWCNNVLKGIKNSNKNKVKVTNEEIKEFYQLFFKRYSQIVMANPKKLSSLSIEIGNFIAFQVLIQDGYYQFNPTQIPEKFKVVELYPTSSPFKKTKRKKNHTTESLIATSLYKCLIYKRTKILQFIYFQVILKLEKKQQTLIIKKFRLKFEEFKTGMCHYNLRVKDSRRNLVDLFKVLVFFLENKLILLKPFQDKVTSSISSHSNYSNQFEECVFIGYKLSHLIIICNTLKKLNDDKSNLVTDESGFNIDQLNSNLELLVNKLIKEQDTTQILLLERIRGLVEYFYNTLNRPFTYLYYSLFKIEIKDTIIFGNENHKNSTKITHSKAMEYADYKTICSLYKSERHDHSILIGNLNDQFILFKHCHNRNDKIQFVKEIIKEVNGQRDVVVAALSEEQQKLLPISPFYLLYILIRYDDIELVQLVIDEFGDIIKSTNNVNINSVCKGFHYLIRSTAMLEFCWNHLNNHFHEQSNSIYYWYRMGRTDLLKSFEKLVFAQTDIQPSSLLLPITKKQNIFNFKTHAYIIENSDKYQFDSSIFNYLQYGMNDQELKQIQYIIKNSDQSIKFQIEDMSNHYTASSVLKFINWLFTFENGIQISSGRIKLAGWYYKALSLNNILDVGSGDIDKWLKVGELLYPPSYSSYFLKDGDPTIKFSKIINLDELFELIQLSGDIKIMDIVFNHYFIPTLSNVKSSLISESSFLNLKFAQLFVKISNQLNLIKHLHSNYNQFLTIKTSGGSGVQSISSLNKLIIGLFENDIPEVFEYLINTVGIKIESSQFNSIISNQKFQSIISLKFKNQFL